jgi:hypothetical protein
VNEEGGELYEGGYRAYVKQGRFVCLDVGVWQVGRQVGVLATTWDPSRLYIIKSQTSSY